MVWNDIILIGEHDVDYGMIQVGNVWCHVDWYGLDDISCDLVNECE